MKDIENVIQCLLSKDNKTAYENLKLLVAESEKSDVVYKFFDQFAEMTKSKHSYVTTRGLLLISANAKWDVENKIDKIIDDYLKHVSDQKPITSRQCIVNAP